MIQVIAVIRSDKAGVHLSVRQEGRAQSPVEQYYCDDLRAARKSVV